MELDIAMEFRKLGYPVDADFVGEFHKRAL